MTEDALTEAKAEEQSTPGSRDTIMQLLNKVGPILALLLVYAFFVILNARMLSLTAVEIIIQQTVIVGISAIGMTLVIISAGIDLSAGSVIAFGSVVVALLMDRLGFGPLPSALGGVLAGLLWGMINGLIITRFKVVPFIVTLGTLLVVRGFAKGLSNNIPINVEQTWLNELLATLPPERQWQLIPPGAWIMILLAVLVAGVLRYTRLGRHIYAIGSNEQTARLCGVAVERVKVIVYSLAGAFSGFAGLMMMSYQEQGDPTSAQAMELDVIAAVVIGGGSLAGGAGSILGSLVGAIIMTVIRVGSQLNGWPTWVTQVATGAIIVIAVAVDRIRHRQAE
ncbi:MAG TPA: ABC transporter permease [bacterium]|nr:ABC transporter permease [bacterium]